MWSACSPTCWATPAGGRPRQYAGSAVVIYSRATAERLSVPLEKTVRRIAAHRGLELTA